MNVSDSKGTILVVDDEPMNIMVLKGLLGKNGYRVISANNGSDCLRMAVDDRPDMILLDVMMPGESGFDVCKKLKTAPATTHIPVIFITCLGEMSNKLAGFDLGAVDYITKPFIAAEVVARVSSHMSFKRRQGDIIEAQALRLGQVQAAQSAMLIRPETLPEARFAVHYMPVLEAGGDFYDVLHFGLGRAAYFIADVSGHDLGASFITSSIKALFREHAATDKLPADVLKGMNRVLCTITAEEVYLTAVCLYVDRFRGSYSLSAAGHPAVVGVLGGLAAFLDQPGLALGMFEDAEFSSLNGHVSPGDRFFLYTDGLAENSGRYATNDGFRESLLTLCRDCDNLPLSAAVEAIVLALSDGSRPTDDVVLLGVDV